MNTVEYKFNPGDTVFAVNCYQTGARIFEGKVIDLYITIKPWHNSKQTTFLEKRYKISSFPTRYFSESCVFATVEEAKDFKEQHLKSIENGSTSF